MRRRWPAALLAAAAALAWPAAHAALWGFVDDRGTAHFAPQQLDARYQLFFRGDQAFDSSTATARPPPAEPSASASKLLAWLAISPTHQQVQRHLREAAREQGIDYALLQALIATESGFDAGAVSPKGAVGLMQIMPATAERYGVRGDRKVPLATKLADPRTNIRTGTRYLRDLMRMFPGRLELALAAYNAGEGAVQRAGNRIPDYRETQNYVKTVLQLYDMLKPAAVAAAGTRAPRRVRMELPGAPAAAAGRRNVPTGWVSDAPEAATPGEALAVQD